MPSPTKRTKPRHADTRSGSSQRAPGLTTPAIVSPPREALTSIRCDASADMNSAPPMLS
jgi:hypothetical protein